VYKSVKYLLIIKTLSSKNQNSFFYFSIESVAYEWGPSKPGLIRYTYDPKKRPDTQVDAMSLGFITPLENAVLLRVDSGTTNDYLEMEIVSCVKNV